MQLFYSQGTKQSDTSWGLAQVEKLWRSEPGADGTRRGFAAGDHWSVQSRTTQESCKRSYNKHRSMTPSIINNPQDCL